MDRDLRKLQFLSFSEICGETLRIIFSRRKDGVWKSSLLYVWCLSLGILGFTMLMISFHFSFQLEKTSMDFPAIILSHLKATWTSFLQFLIFVPILYCFALSSVVYSVACIFSGKEEILSQINARPIVLSVAKRVSTTFLWSFAIIGSYTILALALGFFWVSFDCFRLVGAVVLIFYFMGFVYISSVSHLAQVISILEDVHGFDAFVKSKSLIKGKLGLASAIFVLGFSSATIIVFLFCVAMNFLIIGGLFSSTLSGVSLVLIFILEPVISSMAVLFLLVGQTIVYFVCKSYNEEDIEKSKLVDQLIIFSNGGYSLVHSTADEAQLESAEKPPIFSFQNPLTTFIIFINFGMAFTLIYIFCFTR